MPSTVSRPTSPGRRHAVGQSFTDITRREPERSLVVAAKRGAGRNSSGRITVRHHGGGHKRLLRIVDFARDKTGIPARVAAIQYDPGRSARLALLHYADGEKRYIVAPVGLAVGDRVVSGPGVEAAVGNALPLAQIPLGMPIHNIEMRPGGGGKLVRSAGLSAVVMAKDAGTATVRMPSGEIRLFNAQCMATVGQVGNVDWESVKLGKAGKSRWLGVRPTVRGVAMNPIDHPMGGGEGKASGGHPRSPWGQYAKGMKTRKKRKSSWYIVARRK